MSNQAIINHAHENVTFSREEISWIKNAVLLGLTSRGQLHKALEAKDVAGIIGSKLFEHLDIRSPTGSAAEEVAIFATAINVLDAIANPN